MYDLSDEGIQQLLIFSPDTLRRMAQEAEAHECWATANACWNAIAAHKDIETMPGDKLYALYVTAEANGLRCLALKLQTQLNLRLGNPSREPLMKTKNR